MIIIVKVWKEEKMPVEWECGIINPIHKRRFNDI